MKLPNRYGYGTLFGCSGIDGENRHQNDFIGMLMPQPVSIRFDAEDPVTLYIPVNDAHIHFILPDAIESDELLLLFSDKGTLVGKTAIKPQVFIESGVQPVINDGAALFACNGFFYALYTADDRFAFCREETAERAVQSAKQKITADLFALREQRLAYYRDKPACRRPEYEQLYYKCLSINRVNVYSPQDGFSCRFTTPDRLPHRHMWLWDSMFHAMAFAQYDTEMAKEAILAVLACQQSDGFLPHMMKSTTNLSGITQPQVVAWAVLTVYRATNDRNFLAYCAARTDKYLRWFLTHRDTNGNGLLEWKTDYSNVRCRCDESGMDNSPRFDTTETLDAIDINCFMVHDCRCLAEIYRILGKLEDAAQFEAIADSFTEKINALLWDDTVGAYCDRTVSGQLTGVLSCCSFLPLFAGVCSDEQASRLTKLLKDSETFNTPLPVPSIARNHPDYGADMWRGCVWINFNYFIIQGLRRYGYRELADELKEKTLRTIRRWFNETGAVFEFYDAENQTVPWHLNRKGPQPPVPDYRIRYHAITDFNWTACFTLLLLQESEDAT